MVKDGSKSVVLHGNPFNGKCVHGVSGAIFVSGVLTNPKCEHCSGKSDVGK